jgi:hypothetical protein
MTAPPPAARNERREKAGETEVFMAAYSLF